MDAACTIQDSIHVFSLVHKYVSRILGTYQLETVMCGVVFIYIPSQPLFPVEFLSCLEYNRTNNGKERDRRQFRCRKKKEMKN